MTFRIIFICLGCLFALPGLLLALYNWYSISVWVWRKCRDPRYRKGPDIVRVIGGFLLLIGMVFFTAGVPEMRHSWWVALPLVDYGTLPHLVLTPLLGYLVHLRKTPPGSLPKPPYCKEVQLDFPVLLVAEDELPELVCSPEDLSRKVAELGAVLYADSLCQQVVNVHGRKKSFGSPDVEYTTPSPYKLSKLINLQARLIREDDDALTQFHEASELLPLLKLCAGFHELLALGCLAGWWEAPAASGLPSLCESDLDIATIRNAK